jgi:hypothetical protein
MARVDPRMVPRVRVRSPIHSDERTLRLTALATLTQAPLNHALVRLAERRRSRTYQRMGYMRLPVLKTAEIWLWEGDRGRWVTIRVTTGTNATGTGGL